MNEPIHSRSAEYQAAWNEAFDRLSHFVSTFGLTDQAYASRLTLSLLDEAKLLHSKDQSLPPVTVAMNLAQKRMAEWFATNLEKENEVPADVLETGYIAVLLSRLPQVEPTAFLANPLPEELRQALRETLLVAGPDLNISSMTPRPLDYGPMLQFARVTWHRFNAREFAIAVLFWAGVYGILYWWLSQLL